MTHKNEQKQYMVLGLKDTPLDLNIKETWEADNPFLLSLDKAIEFVLWCKNQKEDSHLQYARIVELKPINEEFEDFNKCVKCYKKLPDGSEYYECRLIDNMGLSVSKKVCLDCFDNYILTTAG